MPIYQIRQTAIPGYAPLAAGVLPLSTINLLQAACKWFSRTGISALQIQGGRTNGRQHPFPGVSGGQSFFVDTFRTHARVSVPNGYNFYTLQCTMTLPLIGAWAGQLHGAVLSLDWMRGDTVVPIASFDWNSPEAAAGYVIITDRLPIMATGNPRTVEDIWLRVTVDLSGGGIAPAGSLVAGAPPVSFRAGVDGLALHLWRNEDLPY